MDRDVMFGRKNRTKTDQQYRRSDFGRPTLRDIYLNDNSSDFGNTSIPTPISYPVLCSPDGFRPFLSPPPYEKGASSIELEDFTVRMANLNLNESMVRSPSISPYGFKSPTPYPRMNRMSTLPPWTLDENREIKNDLTLEKVVDKNLLICFATDKSGCHFLQSNFYGEKTQNVDPKLRERICQEVLSDRHVFLSLCKNIFGNFFLQRVIEYSRTPEQDIIRRYIASDITSLCLDKSACRVVQTALEKLKPQFADSLVDSIPTDGSLMSICTDQNANHVIQKIVKKMPLKKWEFLVEFFCDGRKDNLLNICQDKYGCRVVQTVVETLSVADHHSKDNCEDKLRVLHNLMTRILSRCQKLASNEFANYVIQHIIETPGVLGQYRDAIIEKCLLRNLLSMSQEKYASHVVERAFTFAPLPYLAEMMEEIFDGYVPHPDTGKDAFDILIFHQFGNYVVQRMLSLCCDAVSHRRDTVMNGVDFYEKFEGWLAKLYLRAKKERNRLNRFSSGKKILEILNKMEQKSYGFPGQSSFEIPVCENSSSMFTSSTNTTSNEWTSRKSSFCSSGHQDYDYNYNYHGKY